MYYQVRYCLSFLSILQRHNNDPQSVLPVLLPSDIELALALSWMRVVISCSSSPLMALTLSASTSLLTASNQSPPRRPPWPFFHQPQMALEMAMT